MDYFEKRQRQRLQYLSEAGFHSWMNNTRRREFFERIEPLVLPMRVKALQIETPTDWREVRWGHIPRNYIEIFGHFFASLPNNDVIEIPRSGGQTLYLAPNGGPMRFSEIEWLDILADFEITDKRDGSIGIYDCHEQLRAIFTELRQPFESKGAHTTFRIYGYGRSSS